MGRTFCSFPQMHAASIWSSSHDVSNPGDQHECMFFPLFLKQLFTITKTHLLIFRLVSWIRFKAEIVIFLNNQLKMFVYNSISPLRKKNIKNWGCVKTLLHIYFQNKAEVFEKQHFFDTELILPLKQWSSYDVDLLKKMPCATNRTFFCY